MRVARVILAFMGLLMISGCYDKYTEQPVGTVGIVTKGGGFRTEGGGVDQNVIMPGTKNMAGPWVSADVASIVVTPQLDELDKKNIIMSGMDNQGLSFNLTLGYMVVPPQAWLVYSKFKNYRASIERLFNDCAIRILAKLDMGLRFETSDTSMSVKMVEAQEEVAPDNGNDPVNEEDTNDVVAVEEELVIVVKDFSDRVLVGKAILQDFKKHFAHDFPEYKDAFFFIGVDIGNVDFPKSVLKKMEDAVSASYNTEVLKLEKTLTDLRGQASNKKADSIMRAASIEANSLTADVMHYRSNTIVDTVVENPMIDTVLVIPLDNEGRITWFDHVKVTRTLADDLKFLEDEGNINEEAETTPEEVQ